jgi:hypothetical protein
MHVISMEEAMTLNFEYVLVISKKKRKLRGLFHTYDTKAEKTRYITKRDIVS